MNRVLLAPCCESGSTYWQAWPKNLENVLPGIGVTKQDAIDSVKDNLRSAITTLIGGKDNVKLSWVEIMGYRPIGAEEIWVLVKGAPGPDGKMPVEETRPAQNFAQAEKTGEKHEKHTETDLQPDQLRTVLSSPPKRKAKK